MNDNADLRRYLRAALADFEMFSAAVLGRRLRRYQLEPARAILSAIRGRQGGSFSVMMSRQAGKNELSAQLECYLLNLYQRRGGNIVKCAPTFKPQIVNSLQRLQDHLGNPWNAGRRKTVLGYIVRLGRAQAMFFSAEGSANVVGATAHLALEFDEAQDISAEKHDKEFAPMAAATNATRVYYGTAWDDNTLLERVKQAHLEQERHDGVRRHFEYPWWAVAEHKPLYGAYVEGERARLGESHPLFRTQYKLETIGGTAGFLSAGQRAQMQGGHPRCHRRTDDAVYVAGVDIAGGEEGFALTSSLSQREREEASSPSQRQREGARRDSTVVTVARLSFADADELVTEPRLEVVEHYWWTGHSHRQQYAQLRDLLGNVWECGRVVVDATGMGAPVAEFLRSALGESVVVPLVFTAAAKSRLGYRLLAAVNSGRLKMYAPDGSEECAEFWRQCERAKYTVRANQTLNFYVPETEGHDDFVVSAALCVEAASGYGGPGPAAALARRRAEYTDGRY
ncbi:MAG: hypothetical protein M1370_11685 [Bacteroidetes bacterium]|nr:hypothetical protein [Bacteroidota bacterium]MCL5025743.1 hypothetical protein [Chloroflexota bacterium]